MQDPCFQRGYHNVYSTVLAFTPSETEIIRYSKITLSESEALLASIDTNRYNSG